MLLDNVKPEAKCRPPNAQSHNLNFTLSLLHRSLDSHKAYAEREF